jgi:hypothetical protein
VQNPEPGTYVGTNHAENAAAIEAAVGQAPGSVAVLGGNRPGFPDFGAGTDHVAIGVRQPDGSIVVHELMPGQGVAGYVGGGGGTPGPTTDVAFANRYDTVTGVALDFLTEAQRQRFTESMLTQTAAGKPYLDLTPADFWDNGFDATNHCATTIGLALQAAGLAGAPTSLTTYPQAIIDFVQEQNRLHRQRQSTGELHDSILR